MSRKDMIIDGIVCTVGAACFYVLVYIAFGMDVITTGM
jgi:hypothetical protein